MIEDRSNVWVRLAKQKGYSEKFVAPTAWKYLQKDSENKVEIYSMHHYQKSRKSYWCWWIFVHERGFYSLQYVPKNICDGIINDDIVRRNITSKVLDHNHLMDVYTNVYENIDIYLGEYDADNNAAYTYSGEKSISCKFGEKASNMCNSVSDGDSSLSRP